MQVHQRHVPPSPVHSPFHSPASVLQNSVVVFSKNYLPMSRINIRRAIALLITGQAEPIEFTSPAVFIVRSPSIVMHVPEHIRLTMTNPERLWKLPPVNRREVLKRDNHSCQYCGATKGLTLDHVIPRSKGGQHTWDNVVTACGRCNGQKGNRFLHETDMVLKAKLKAPAHPAIAFAEQFWKDHQDDF
jgi:5-methylcytosine-specific restriction endonuclease McrA